MTAQKSLVGVDILVDDAPMYLTTFKGYAIAMDRPYNRDIINCLRVYNNDWLQLETIIKGLSII